jgi:O-antigen/teichoic acid export membrane protein
LLQRAISNREARVVTVFSGLQLLLALAGNRVLTGVVPPKLLGEYYLYTNLLLWFSLPAASLYVYFMRHWPLARERGVARRLAGRMNLVVAAQAGLAVAGSVLVAVVGLASWPFVPLLALIPAAAAIQQLHGQVPALERRRVLAGWLALMSASRPWFLAGAVLLPSLSALTLLVLHLACSALETALTLVVLRWLLRGVPEKPVAPPQPVELGARSMLYFALPYAITAVVAQGAGTAERWGLAAKADTAATALFVQAVGIATAAAGAVCLPLNTYFFPLVSQAVAQNGCSLSCARSSIRRYLVLTACVLAVFVTGLAFLAAPLTSLLLGREYLPVSGLLPWTAVALAFFSMGQALTVVPFASRDPWAPNLALWCAKGLYLVALILTPLMLNAVHQFCVVFAASNLVYLILMACFALRTWRRGASLDTLGGGAIA